MPRTATRWFEFIVYTKVSVLGWRRIKGVSGAWAWREGCHVIAVSHWDFRGDYVNLSVGHNESTCDGCDFEPFEPKFYIIRTFQILDKE